MLQYFVNKIQDDYVSISMNYKLGTILTNLSLLCSLWEKRLTEHFAKYGNKLYLTKFIEDNPLSSEPNII